MMPAPKDPIKYQKYILHLSLSHKGKHPSVSTRKKMAEACKGEKNHFFGKTHSEESKKRIGKSGEGRIPWNKGKSPSIETCKKIKEKTEMAWKDPILREKMTIPHIGMFKGEKHPQWRGGISFIPYCEKFNNRFRERVRAFFGYHCMMPGCDYIWKPGEKRLAVHHVNYKKDSCCNQETKPLFVPVCPNGCHNKTNHNRGYWEQYFTNLINQNFGGKCYLTEDKIVQRLKP